MHALVSLCRANEHLHPSRVFYDLLEGLTQVTLSLMFAAVTPGRVEKVDGPTRGVTTAGGCACTGKALYCQSCVGNSLYYRTYRQLSALMMEKLQITSVRLPISHLDALQLWHSNHAMRPKQLSVQKAACTCKIVGF